MPTSVKSYKYDSFVSYATSADAGIAREVEAFLESFHRLPVPDGESLRQLAVCRDGTDFSHRQLARAKSKKTDENKLWELIRSHLEQSRTLIVLCSRLTPKHSWQEREVRWFLEQRGVDAIVLVATEGTVPERWVSEILPPITELDPARSGRPVLDLRGFTRARRRGALSLRNFEEERIRLAAELYETDPEQIRPVWLREQSRRNRRRARVASAVAIAMMLLAAVAGWQWSEARRSQAKERRARWSAQGSLATQLSGDGGAYALELGLSALLQALDEGASPPAETRQGVDAALHSLQQALPLEHGGPVELLAIDREHDRIGTSGRDRQVKIWQRSTGAPLAQFATEGQPQKLAWLPGNEALVTLTDKGTLSRRSAAADNSTASWAVEGVRDFSVHADGSLAVSTARERQWLDAEGRRVWQQPSSGAADKVSAGQIYTVFYSDDGRVDVYDRQLQKSVAKLSVSGNIVGMSFIESPERLVLGSAVAGGQGEIRIWAAPFAALPSVIPVPSLRQLVTSADGALALSWGWNQTASVWNLSSGKQLGRDLAHPTDPVAGSLLPALHAAVTGDERGQVFLWDYRTGRMVQQVKRFQQRVNVVSTAPGRDWFVVGSDDGRALVTDWSPDDSAAQFASSAPGGLHLPNAAAWLDPEQVIFGVDGRLRLWKPSKSESVELVEQLYPMALSASSKAGRALVAGWTAAGNGGEAALIDIPGRRVLAKEAHAGRAIAAVLHPDGDWGMTGCGQGEVRLWHVTGNGVVSSRIVGQHPGGVAKLALLARHRLVISAGNDGELRAWNAQGEVRPLGRHEVAIQELASDESSEQVISGDANGRARIWQVETGSVGEPFEHPGSAVTALALGVGAAVVAWSDGLAELRAADQSIHLTPSGAGDYFIAAAFSPDASLLVLATRSRLVTVWEVPSGKPISTFNGTGGSIRTLSMNADGRRLLVHGDDGTARIFDVSSEGLARRGCRYALALGATVEVRTSCERHLNGKVD